MVKFVQVDPQEIDNLRQPHRGRVSYPILKGFLETDLFLAKLDRTGVQQSLQNLYTTLASYIRSHDMPIKLFRRAGEVYLMRLDIDEDGNEIPNWKKVRDIDPTIEPRAIDSEEVKRRFDEEKDQTTK
jgi:hypothetical protein